MRIEVTINKKNKEKVLRLISELLDEEDNKLVVDVEGPTKTSSDKIRTSSSNELIAKPQSTRTYLPGRIFKLPGDVRGEHIGPWIQFNSYFPVKAGLRILSNMINRDNTVEDCNLLEFVNTCEHVFRDLGYHSLRGFPSSDKDSAIGRFVLHFLFTALEMGLIRVSRQSLPEGLATQGIPASRNNWDQVWISPSMEGFEFALLPNKIFDYPEDFNKKNQIATNEERRWWLQYISHLDDQGYKLYSIMKSCYDYLNAGHDGKEELPAMLKNHPALVNYVEKSVVDKERWDRIKKDYALILAGTNIAMLRELGLVSSVRGEYKVIGDINEANS
jgi:hypothetical protein